MAATFSDDAYNKRAKGSGVSGTLIGNWLEERAVRDATGEGRSLPQRHIPRSGLLVDWTKVPSGGARKQDDTFERIYGPKVMAARVPQSKVIGAGESDIVGGQLVADTLQAEGRVEKVGARLRVTKAAMLEDAELQVQEEEEERERLARERFFETTSGSNFQKPDETQSEKAQFSRKSHKLELMHGPEADRSRAFGNTGLDFQSSAHYSNVEPVTHPRMGLTDPLSRCDMKVSAHGGVSAFGRHSEFSKPINEFLKGLSKDEEMEHIYESLRDSQPHNCTGGTQPRAAAFSSVPSLTTLKGSIHRQIGQVWGPQGYVVFRQRLCDRSDHEGFVSKSDVVAVLRQDLGLDGEEVTDIALDVYLGQLLTMRKEELRVGSLISSLRPALPLSTKRRILDAFGRLGPGTGVCQLGDWLGRLSDAELRQTLVGAFGAEDEDSAASLPLTEQVFLELLSDLAPLMDMDALLA